MKDSATLILIRHGESLLGRARRYAGHRDTPLSPEGKRQIANLRAKFRRLRPDALISSDLRRCRQTAALLDPDARVEASAHLRELDFGDWDGLTSTTCRRRNPARFDRWMRDPWSVRPPHGEKLTQLWTRVRRYVSDLARRHKGETVAIVTHAGPIRVLLAAAPEKFWDTSVPVGALFTIRWNAGRRRRDR